MPTPRAEPAPEIEARFEILQRFVVAVRQLRASSQIKDTERLVVMVKPLSDATRPMLEQADASVKFLAKLDKVEFVQARQKGWAAQFDPDFELYVDLSQYVDLDEERARLEREIAKAEKEIASSEKQLSNEKFVSKAPADKVEGVRNKLAESQARLQKLKETRAELE